MTPSTSSSSCHVRLTSSDHYNRLCPSYRSSIRSLQALQAGSLPARGILLVSHFSSSTVPPQYLAVLTIIEHSFPRTAYLRNLRHKSALCDRHMEPITGKWYRCVYCAKDLCAECEAIDEHDMTHCFMVFKAPVDIGLFR